MTETRNQMDPLATMTATEYTAVMRNLDRRGLAGGDQDWHTEDRANTEAVRVLRVLRAR